MVAIRKLLSAFSLLSLSALVAGDDEFWHGEPKENCEPLPDYAREVGHGTSEDGSKFCASKFKQGILPKMIELQGGIDSLRGMRVTYSDNSFTEVGEMEFHDKDPELYSKIQWDPLGDTVKRLVMWDTAWNHASNRAIGQIILEYNIGAEGSQKIGKSTQSPFFFFTFSFSRTWQLLLTLV